MTHGIVVGLDGTDQANAAAQWAAEEAVLRGTGVHLVHVKETPPDVPPPFAPREPDEAWAEDLLARTAAGLRERHPDLAVTTRLLPSEPVVSLVAAAEQSDLLALGSRALGGTTGYLIGSVGMSVAGLSSADGRSNRSYPNGLTEWKPGSSTGSLVRVTVNGRSKGSA